MKRTTQVIAILAALSSSCYLRTPNKQQASMEQLGSRLTYLTAAIRGSIPDKSLPDSATDREIVAASTRDDPSLAKPFDGYVLRVEREGKHAVVLVCTPDVATALLEDASCTPELDGRQWEVTPPQRCEFTLSGVCSR
jgi:hypothetical protein